MAHTGSWDEAAPNGATVKGNTLDTIIQGLKIAIRERMNDVGCSTWSSGDPVAFDFLRMVGATPYIIGGSSHLIGFKTESGTLVGHIDGVTGALIFDLASLATASIDALVVSNSASFQGNVTVDLAQAAITPFDAGNSGAALVLDWNNGNNQLVTLTSAVAVMTFTNPVAGSVYIIKFLQDATGSRQPSFPASVKWAGGSFPGCTGTANHSDLITLYYDGANYLGTVAGFNFSA